MTNILNLPGVIVENEIQTAETLIFTVKLSKKTAIFPHCSQTSHRLHQNQGYLLRNLSICDKKVILKVNRRKFKCTNCQKPFSDSLDFVDKKKNFTHRYAETITKQVIHSDINNVAENNKLIGDEVWSMVKSVAEKTLPIDLKNLTRLGIDEISLTKGQGKLIVLLVDLDTHKLIGVVAKRKRSGRQKVMRQWGEKVLSQIK